MTTPPLTTPAPDMERVTVNLYRYADEIDSYYAVEIVSRGKTNEAKLDKIINRSVKDDNIDAFVAPDFETAISLALDFGGIMQPGEWMG